MLPEVQNDTDLDAFMSDDGAVRAVLDQLGQTVGIDGTLTRAQRGSAIVGLSEHEVLKVMAPHDASYAETERACLLELHGHLPVATPELLGTGEIDGWHWTRMRRLPGSELVDVWPTLGGPDQLRLASQLGEALTVMHSCAAPPSLERVDWSTWVQARTDSIVEDQRAKDCPESLLVGLDELIASADLSEGETGWLHTEVMQEHLLVQESNDGWQLSGLFDFEPSWVAPIDYEFASVGLFFSAGNAAILGEVLRAAGRSPTPARLFAMTLVHRYANLGWFHQRLGGPTNVEALAEHWFASSA